MLSCKTFCPLCVIVKGTFGRHFKVLMAGGVITYRSRVNQQQASILMRFVIELRLVFEKQTLTKRQLESC